MYNGDTEIRYFTFRCRYPECNEIIPSASFISRFTFSAGSLFLKGQDVEKGYNLITIDVACPFCCALNHFQISEHVRELSREDYEEEHRAVKTKLALRHEINEVFAKDHQTLKGSSPTMSQRG